MVEKLIARIAEMLRRARAIKPQTQRQLQPYLSEHNATLPQLLLCAADVMEDYELDIAFGPLFTPSLDERAELADLLVQSRPNKSDVDRIIKKLCEQVGDSRVRLPDGTDAQLTLHEVMIERFVNLLRLDSGAEPALARTLYEVLPQALVPIGVALLCEPGMTPDRQQWFVGFVAHVSRQEPAISRELLETVAGFIASQPATDREQLLAAARALRAATETTAAHTSAGHAYWSADVAQHHHYRGQGNVDQAKANHDQAELARVNAMVEAMQTFEWGTSDE